jgi:hypothetical protein
METNNFKLVKEAIDFWAKVANENKWSMKNKGCTVWVDKTGQLKDSIYNPLEGDESFIVDYETEEIIEIIKH